MIDELKPCPFHNSHTCGCCDSLDAPPRVWNTRPLEDGLRADIARLTAELAAALKRAEAAEQSESGLARALTTAMAELTALREAANNLTKELPEILFYEWGDQGIGHTNAAVIERKVNALKDVLKRGAE